VVILTILMCVVSALYGTAGQAGGSGFVAVMTFATFPIDEIRATALALNIIAASYATLQAHRMKSVDWPLLRNLVAASVPAALIGGMVVLRGPVYSAVTGALLLLVSILMVVRKSNTKTSSLKRGPALVAGAATGFASGITGVGGGIFMSSVLILLGKASPKKTAALSPPFILVNSLAALVGVFVTGQRIPIAALPFAGAVIVGSAIGIAIGLRWMSELAIRYVLAAILLAGAAQMLTRVFA